MTFDCEASARNKVFPPGLTEEMVTADPDVLRVRPVDVTTFWDDLEEALDFNPVVGADDAPMADQARTLIALRKADPAWKALIDHVTLEADTELHDGAKYHQVGVDVGNGWQRQANAGLWGTDWFGRAQAAVIYIFVNDFHEALYFIRGTDAADAFLFGRYRYTMTFRLARCRRWTPSSGGFWSLTMYDQDYYMPADSPNGRHNIGTVNLDANELTFARDGSLTLHLSHEPPTDQAAQANWLPAPDGQFALIVRAYVPTEPLLTARTRCRTCSGYRKTNSEERSWRGSSTARSHWTSVTPRPTGMPSSTRKRRRTRRMCSSSSTTTPDVRRGPRTAGESTCRRWIGWRVRDSPTLNGTPPRSARRPAPHC